MHIWQVQEAKAKLTQFINEAKITPQIISRRGEPEIVAMSIAEYHKLIGPKNDLLSFLRTSPLYGANIKIDRDKTPMRDIDL